MQTGNVKTLLLLCLAISSLLSGCTTLGSHVISNPATYLSDSRLSNIDLQRFDTEKRQLCVSMATSGSSAQDSTCFHYLFAKAYQPEDFAEDQHVQYQVSASGNGVENIVKFQASPRDFKKRQGTAVLFHGFGGSKEAMLVTSIWFRAQGFDIIAFDLFGHGESTQDFAFGAKEHELIRKALIQLNQSEAVQQPVISVGHSMGSLPAINTLKYSPLVDGAILMAPMVRFDAAAKHYLAYKSSWLNQLFSGSMDQIVADAMQHSNVSVKDTDVPSILRTIDKPTLILSSDIDTVSPLKAFSTTGNPAITQEILRNRSHPSLISFDSKDSVLIEAWLKQHF